MFDCFLMCWISKGASTVTVSHTKNNEVKNQEQN